MFGGDGSCMLESINEVQKKHGIVLKFNEGMADWERVLEDSEYVPVRYTLASIEYQYRYIESFYKVSDKSIVFYSNGQACGVWPLYEIFYPEGGELVSFPNKTVWPILFNKFVSAKIRKHCIEAATDLLREYYGCNGAGERYLQVHDSIFWNLKNDKSCEWYRKWMERGATASVTSELYLDLSASLEQIRQTVRKSYRNLINKAGTFWRAQVYTKIDYETFEKYRCKHIEVSGRITRSKESWNSQYEAINKGDAFLVMLKIF